MSENIYSWEFDDNKNRWTLWYIIALSFVIWISIWWFFTKQYWMSFIVLLIAWLVYFVENNSEDLVEVIITNLWVKIAWVFYDFTGIESFWIVYKWEDPILLRLNLNKKWLRNIDVKIDSTIVKDIKDVLLDYIKEIPKIELTFSEKMIKLLKL
jgi:hypothetical protein